MSARGEPSTRIGIIGCGNIAPVYIRTLKQMDWVEIVGFADGLTERSIAFAQRHGGSSMSIDEMLGDPTIEAVLNLTPASSHALVTRSILAAGKAAFSEKPLGIDLVEGQSIIALADQSGLRLGCAPDTFLGAGLQTARAAIDRGSIGEPLAANGFMLGFGPEWWHPNPEIFYGPGGGPLLDMGPYYLTALVHLLGPAASVIGSARTAVADRVVHARGRVGDVVHATAPTHVSSIIEFASGAVATLVTSFDVKATTYRNIEIYGTEGTLAVPDPNTFGGPVKIRGILNDDWRELELTKPNIPQQRGIGFAEMLSATRAGRQHRASGELAFHVLEAMHGIVASSAQGRRFALQSTCAQPELMRFDLEPNCFD
jgi:predicted dehydrogenase